MFSKKGKCLNRKASWDAQNQWKESRQRLSQLSCIINMLTCVGFRGKVKTLRWIFLYSYIISIFLRLHLNAPWIGKKGKKRKEKNYNCYKTQRWHCIKTYSIISTCYCYENDSAREPSDEEAKAAATSNSCIVNSLVEWQNFAFERVSVASDSVSVRENSVFVASTVLSINIDLDI